MYFIALQEYSDTFLLSISLNFWSGKEPETKAFNTVTVTYSIMDCNFFVVREALSRCTALFLLP